MVDVIDMYPSFKVAELVSKLEGTIVFYFVKPVGEPVESLTHRTAYLMAFIHALWVVNSTSTKLDFNFHPFGIDYDVSVK